MGRKRTGSQYDDITDAARGLLYFRHLDRISQKITDPNQDGVSLDDETLHMEMLSAPDTIDKKAWDYEEELERIASRYTEPGRLEEEARSGRSIPPMQWHAEKRFYERRANFIQACVSGMLSRREIQHVGEIPTDFDAI